MGWLWKLAYIVVVNTRIEGMGLTLGFNIVGDVSHSRWTHSRFCERQQGHYVLPA